VTIKERFDRFHAANPRVWELFVRFANEAIARGRHNLGARMIWERIRWETEVVTHDPTALGRSEYRLNDHYPPYDARLFMKTDPQHAGFFNTRHVQADDEQTPHE
jgi:hypothetical protein